jgi:hypothetical protein
LALASGLVQHRQVVQPRRGRRMIAPEAAFEQRYRSPVQRKRFVQPA